MAEYKSRTVVLKRSAEDIYRALTDLERFKSMIPSTYADQVRIEGNSIKADYAGFNLVVALTSSEPFSRVVYSGVDSPFPFSVEFIMEPLDDSQSCNFTIAVDAELNFMMKALLGSKIKEYLDKTVTALSQGGFPTV